jgi:hypothetical protein
MPPVIVPHPNTIRGPIEITHNDLRDAREKQYVTDKLALEADFHADLAVLKTNKEAALLAAGLNTDGGVPESYPTPFFVDGPDVTGTAQVGQTLTCAPGTVVDDDSLAYQWYRDDVAIGGATANTRVLAGPDLGLRMHCVVTATNEHGSNSKASNKTVPVIAA